MRILLLNADPAGCPGAIKPCVAQMRGLASALMRAGHLVDCAVAARDDHAELVPLQSRGLSLHALPARAGRAVLDRLLAACRPDVILEHLAPLAPHAAESAAGRGITHLFEVSTRPDAAAPPGRARPEPAELEGFLKRAFAASRGGVTSLPNAADWVRTVAPREFEVSLLPDSAGPAATGPLPEALRLWARSTIAAQAGEFVVGFSGSFKPWHDLDTLVLAMSQLRERVPARLVLVGDGPARNSLLAQTYLHKVPAVFAGSVGEDETRALLESCDAIAVPYARAGADFSPLKLVEVMAAGRPIVATETAPARRVLGAGASGLLVPAGDAAAFAQALEKLAAQPVLREKLSAAASRRSLELYSWDLAAERLLAFAAACRARAENCA